MDLSFARFDRDVEPTTLTPDLAMLIVVAAARQAASATAAAQFARSRRLADDWLFRPGCGAFNRAVADAIIRWRNE